MSLNESKPTGNLGAPTESISSALSTSRFRLLYVSAKYRATTDILYTRRSAGFGPRSTARRGLPYIPSRAL